MGRAIITAVLALLAAWLVVRAAFVDAYAARDPGKPLQRFERIADAYRCARESAGDDDRILAFGSFHTVAEILASHADRSPAGEARR